MYKSIKALAIGSFLTIVGSLPEVLAQDSIHFCSHLDTIQVVARRIHHANEANAGARVTSINPEVLLANRTRSLSELLADNSAVYIKSMGTGALATASFRGGSAAQTRVNWNGINITPPMSGTFDFSQIPVFFVDDVNLYYGSSHVKNGTGAVGGSVNLFTDPDWGQGVSGRAFGEYGSYNTYTTGAQINVAKNRTSFKTRAYYQHSDNDYKYINKVLTNTPFRERRVDADYSQWGVMQEGYLRLSPYARFTAVGWAQGGEHMLPQPLGVVQALHERQKDLNLRAYTGIDFSRGLHELHVKAAWLYFQQDYDKWYKEGKGDPTGTSNRSQTWQGIADYSFAPTEGLVLNTSLTYMYDHVKATSYIWVDPANHQFDGQQLETPEPEPAVKEHRNVWSWQASARWEPMEWLLLNGQYMYERNEGRPVSTWSAGLVVNLFERALQLKGSTSYNYRFPSMNDMYWRPGGNPDVKPEHGHSYDFSVSYKKDLNAFFTLNAEVSAYIMNIDDWIVWLPKEGNQWFWTPQNKRDVRSEGIEVYGRLLFHIGDFRAVLAGNYSWSRSRSRHKQHEDDGSFMKQVPYVPRHKCNARLELDYKKAFASWQTLYTGRRYVTTDESYSTDAYTVHNLLVGYRHTFVNGMKLTPQLRVDNVCDAYYESTQYYPMPLRNFLFSLMFEF